MKGRRPFQVKRSLEAEASRQGLLNEAVSVLCPVSGPKDNAMTLHLTLTRLSLVSAKSELSEENQQRPRTCSSTKTPGLFVPTT